MFYTRDDIENIAVAVLREYGAEQDAPLDLMRFTCGFLGLALRFENLSRDNDVLGITTYEDVELKVYGYGNADLSFERIIEVPKDTVLISRGLLPENCDSVIHPFSRGRLRFTIAHECAHQILYRKDRDARKQAYRVVTGRPYSVRELKSRGDWCEWQANALASALLMPATRVAGLLREPLMMYGDIPALGQDLIIGRLTESFAVSRAALLLRLERLGFLVRRRADEYPFDEEAC